jgi:hypothetical protein
MEIEIGALCLWLVAISVFGVGAMFGLTATLSRIKSKAWW